jgi:hypothetical protein
VVTVEQMPSWNLVQADVEAHAVLVAAQTAATLAPLPLPPWAEEEDAEADDAAAADDARRRRTGPR